MSEQKTHADIIAEMRRGFDKSWHDIDREWAHELADRLKAALRRERGDCAKLREAVKAVVDVGYPHNFQREAPHIRGYCYDITRAIEKCFAALATEQEGGAEVSDLIQWPTAKYWTTQWNPVIGCKPCSPACEHCAGGRRMRNRRRQALEQSGQRQQRYG